MHLPTESRNFCRLTAESVQQNADIVPDFAEGVTHLLVNKRKDRAAWKPSSISATSDDQILDIFFNADRKYTHLVPPEPHMEDYMEYPHSNYGLPSENKIVQVAVDQEWNEEAVLKWVKERYGNKPGLEEHVKEVLRRKQM